MNDKYYKKYLKYKNKYLKLIGGVIHVGDCGLWRDEFENNPKKQEKICKNQRSKEKSPSGAWDCKWDEKDNKCISKNNSEEKLKQQQEEYYKNIAPKKETTTENEEQVKQVFNKKMENLNQESKNVKDIEQIIKFYKDNKPTNCKQIVKNEKNEKNEKQTKIGSHEHLLMCIR